MAQGGEGRGPLDMGGGDHQPYGQPPDIWPTQAWPG